MSALAPGTVPASSLFCPTAEEGPRINRHPSGAGSARTKSSQATNFSRGFGRRALHPCRVKTPAAIDGSVRFLLFPPMADIYPVSLKGWLTPVPVFRRQVSHFHRHHRLHHCSHCSQAISIWRIVAKDGKRLDRL